jgi:hypothetical protein
MVENFTINEMTDHKKKVIYSFLAEGLDKDACKVEKTLWKNKRSSNSFSFKSDDDIFNYFEIDKNKDFETVTNGEGNEKEKIRALHSSALASFLLFSKIRDDNKLTIDGIAYNKVYFEVESEVIDHPSSIDVLLCSEKNDLLYLECKFSEYYLYAGACKDISSKYLESKEISSELYSRMVKMSKAHLEIVEDNDNTFSLEGKCGLKHYYCEGIKQMISHIVGVSKGFTTKTLKKYPELLDAYKNARSKKIGTVLFKFNVPNIKPYFCDYSELYKQLASVATGLDTLHSKKIGAIQEVLTYQGILLDSDNERYLTNLSERIKRFYHL